MICHIIYPHRNFRQIDWKCCRKIDWKCWLPHWHLPMADQWFLDTFHFLFWICAPSQTGDNRARLCPAPLLSFPFSSFCTEKRNKENENEKSEKSQNSKDESKSEAAHYFAAHFHFATSHALGRRRGSSSILLGWLNARSLVTQNAGAGAAAALESKSAKTSPTSPRASPPASPPPSSTPWNCWVGLVCVHAERRRCRRVFPRSTMARRRRSTWLRSRLRSRSRLRRRRSTRLRACRQVCLQVR